MEISRFSEKIRSKLPLWFNMKKSPNHSIGAQFLNIFGLQLDDIDAVMNYAFEQTTIDSIDNEFIDLLHRAILPINFDFDKVEKITGDKKELTEITDLFTFLNLKKTYGTNYSEEYVDDSYYIDKENSIIYLHYAYGIKNIMHGEIVIHYDGKVEAVETTIHHMWNFFDDLGALVGCKRLIAEPNENFKERILNVFRFPQNSTERGLANAVANDIGIRKTEKWERTDRDFIIYDKMVILKTISVNGKYITNKDFEITKDNEIVIYKNAKLPKDSLVSYISGLTMKALNATDDLYMSNLLFNADGTAKDKLKELIESSRKKSSMLWGSFKYDEAMWSKNDNDFSNEYFGFVSPVMDADIKGFANYGFIDTEIEYIT